MRRLLKMAIVFAIPALALAGCGTNHSWNQKLTVKVNTPNGEKTGSAVTRVSVTVGRQFATDRILSFGVRGEAAIVDLGAGKYIFALLSSSGPGSTEYLADNTLGHLVRIDQNQDEVSRLNAKYSAYEKLRGAVPVPSKNYTLLVTFADINNPKSVREIKSNNLVDAFGAGYSLKAVTLEITDEEVTEEIEEKLPWLNQLDKYLTDPTNPFTSTLPKEIGGLKWR